MKNAICSLSLLLCAVAAGCVTLRDDFEATPSYAFDRPQETALGRAYAAEQARQAGKSGYRLLNGGVAALLTRAAMAELGERSIDAQYFVFEQDAAGAFLLERLIAAGVELHEYRVDAERPAPKGHLMRHGSTDSALHAKVIVYDRRTVWIGSANSDPRSRRINTEAGLLIQSEALAERVLKGLEQDFSPQHSWRLALDGDAGTGGRRIVWTGEQDGQPVRLESEPGGGFPRGLGAWFYSLLPGIESLL